MTSNANKLAEVKSILSATGITLESKSIEITEIQGSIEEISKDKARRAAENVCCSSVMVIENRNRLLISVSRLAALFLSKIPPSVSMS